MYENLEEFKKLYRGRGASDVFIPFSELIPSLQELFIVVVLSFKYNIDFTISKN